MRATPTTPAASCPTNNKCPTPRAHNVCNWLTHHGAHVTTTTQSMGPANPVVIGGTGPSRTGNRRVIITVTH